MKAPQRCGLCREERALRDSHYMPAALYPRNRKNRLATRTQSFLQTDQVTDRVFCSECEQRFNRFGESEVLRWIAPKAKRGTSPLLQALRQATPLWSDASDGLACYSGSALGLPAEKFAYFALSLAWRASVHSWQLPDGSRTELVDLGEFSEPVRMFLLGKAEFPRHTFLMLTICTDDQSQQYWASPRPSAEVDGMIVIPILGLLFRLWMGTDIPTAVRKTIFFPSPGNAIYASHCWDMLSAAFDGLFAV